MARALRSLVALLVVASAAPAWAQRGIEVQTLRPALDGFGLFAIERAETSKQWEFGFKLFADYAHRPLRLPMKASGVTTGAGATVMDYQVALRLGAHLGLADWLELALEVPVSAQRYADVFGVPLVEAAGGAPGGTGFYAPSPRTNIGPPTAGPMDPRVALKARTKRLGPVGLGLIVAATVPFGDESAFLGDEGFTLRPAAVIDLTVGRLTLALNGGATLRRQTTVYDPADVAAQQERPGASLPPPAVLISVGTEVSAGLGAAVRVTDWLSLAAESYALVPVTGGAPTATAGAATAGGAKDYVVDVLGGAMLRPGRGVTVSLGGGGAVLDGHRAERFRAFLGISWTPTGGGSAARGGDRDGDGVPDGADVCPGEPEDRDGFEDDDGCPDPDNDGDGVPDGADRCPGELEDRDGFEDADGCPDPDNDGDGIRDASDRCPDAAEDKDGFDDDDGCAEPDNDLDRIPDAADRCPDEAETENGVDDQDGCPDTGGASAGRRAEPAGAALPEVVFFNRGRARLGSSQRAVVERVAKRLRASKSARLRVVGHAEADEAARAPDVARARAEAVAAELARVGVDAARVEVGSDRPEAARRGSAARARQRRVDFVLVER